MGLDFTIYWDDINNPIDWNDDNFTYDDFKEHELCYGRKSWELVRALNLPVDYDGVDPEVKKEDWVNLIKSMLPIASKFESILKAYQEYLYYDKYEVESISEKYRKLMAEYEAWYDKTFDDYPTLGYDFSVVYMQEFYEANEEVMKCFDDPSKIVRASISY